MKSMSLCVLLFVAVVSAKSRYKREAFDLPDGADLLVGIIKKTFACPQGAVGYYADTENDCKIFHVCNAIIKADGTSETQQFSFLCGNLTIFNQLSFTCTFPEDAVPCSSAPSFYYLNDHLKLADPKVNFLEDQDIQKAAPIIPSYVARYQAGGKPLP